MRELNLGCFQFSTYILIIGISFILSFIVFYHISKRNFTKLDILLIYVINIIGFAVGAKLLSLFSNGIKITILNFINSGYSFLGGIIASILLVALYCKIYKLDFIDMLSSFTVIYPLIYSVSKIGCYLNGCCYGIININDINCKFPLQLFDSALMLILFLILLMMFVKFCKNKVLVISVCFIVFSAIRFLGDFFRDSSNVLVFNFTLEQILCGVLVITSVILMRKTKNKYTQIAN